MAAAAAVASVRDALAAASDALGAAGVEEPRLDAELLLAEATGWERAAIVAGPEAEVPAAAARRFGEMVRRRLRREPLAYVVGRKGFRRLELAVDGRVLIPRPETEMLVELALELGPGRVLDVGTGSGAIALAVADELPDCAVTATDTSPAALAVAGENAERLGLGGRVEFLEGTLPGAGDAGPRFDLVLANLPYVAERDWRSLQPEITRWEPKSALLAGPDGLDAYRSFFAPPGGRGFRRYPTGTSTTGVVAGGVAPMAPTVAVEVGDGQAQAVAELARSAGFEAIEVRRDLAGIERVVVARSSSQEVR